MTFSQPSPPRCSRRTALKQCAAALVAVNSIGSPRPAQAQPPVPAQFASRITVRGIYGGFPNQILDRGQTPADFGVNAIWVGSGSLNAAQIDRYHKLGVKV